MASFVTLEMLIHRYDLQVLGATGLVFASEISVVDPVTRYMLIKSHNVSKTF